MFKCEESCIILFSWIIVRHVLAINYLDCASISIESDCNEYKSEGCHWIKFQHVGECISINCYDFSSERESCIVYKSDYNCYWQDLPQINHAICYEHCPKLFDIVFILNINNAKDAPKVLSYTKSIVSIFNTTYGGDNAHFALVLFSIIEPVIVFDLNTGWNTDQYLSQLDAAFDSNGRNSLLFNDNRANESKAISTAKRKVFQTSNRWQMSNTQLRKLAIYLSAQDYYSIEDICSYSQSAGFDTDDISFYGAKINTNGTFNCVGDTFKFVTDPIVSHDDLYDDIDYLLSSLCPHTLRPTVSPTLNPTKSPTLSPTVAWHKIAITNNTCVSSSDTQQFRFHLPFNGIVSGISLQYKNGSREENNGYWGTTTLNQFAVFIEDYATQSPLYPTFSASRGVIRCNEKYINSPANVGDKLLDFYYCFDGDDVSVNDTEFVLYAPSYTVTKDDEWSVVYVDDLLNAFMQQSEQEIVQSGTICFAVYVLYDSINSKSPTSAPITNEPSSNPTVQITNEPSSNPTVQITQSPTEIPTISTTTSAPTDVPSQPPSDASVTTTLVTHIVSTMNPTSDPTFDPTSDPTSDPTFDPTIDPTSDPTSDPTFGPTAVPTETPTNFPTEAPTFAPTKEKRHARDCCEWFSSESMTNIKCDVDTLTKMRRYSDYLITNKQQCLRTSNCGYWAYVNNGDDDESVSDDDDENLKCVDYWLNVVLFKQKCVKLEAYTVYTTDSDNTCYMCEEHRVVYNDSAHVDGICPQPPQNEEQSTVITTELYTTNDPTNDPTKYPLVGTTSLPTLSPVDNVSAEQHSQIIIHYSNTEDDAKGNKKNGCEVIVKCGADRTGNLCVFVVLSSALASAIVMWTIRSYYQWNFVEKDNASFNDSFGALRAVGYVRQFSDKSDIEEVKKGKGKKMKSKKEKENKKNKNKHVDKEEKEKKKRAKKKKRKRERDDIKSKILAAISESDDIELGVQ